MDFAIVMTAFQTVGLSVGMGATGYLAAVACYAIAAGDRATSASTATATADASDASVAASSYSTT